MKFLAVGLFVLSAAFAQPEAARNLNARGVAAYANRDYAGAERLYRESIAKWVALGDAFTAHLGITRVNLGEALSAQGRRGEAQPELEQALVLLRRSLGAANEHTLDCINLLAAAYLIGGDLDRGGALLEEALGIEREHFPDTVELTRTLCQLANLRLRTDHIDEALAPAEESLALAIKTTGEDSPDTALAYTVVAEAHRLADRPVRALPLYRRAQLIYEKELGPEHPRVASILGQEGLVLAGDGQLASAAQVLQRALDMLGRTCPGCSFERWIIDCNFARVRIRQGKLPAAERLLAEAAELSQRTQGEPAAEVAEVQQQLADARRKQQIASANGRSR
jgi:tetratricopeptide (TPR) repeat protein